MKILLITTNYTGGAGIACRRQHLALLAGGIDSSLLVLDKVETFQEKKVFSIQEIISEKYSNTFFIFLKFINKVFNKLPVFLNPKAYINGPTSFFRIDKLKVYKEADIVHFHWVPKIISYKHVFADKKKIFFWTLHDMNPFTGGNHYTKDFKYEKYSALLKRNIASKIKYLKNVNLTVIAPSVWIGKIAKESEVFRQFEVHLIPNCIDTNLFKPANKNEARNRLNLKLQGEKNILFVAENTNDSRKGIYLLLSALKKIKDKSNINLLIIGKKMNDLGSDFEVKQLGFISNQTAMIQCYNAADFFVIPSIEDNLPNTVLESLACGTPVIGFKIGGVPDMVIHAQTGLLSEIDNEQEFIKNIESYLLLNDYNKLSINCTNLVQAKFSEKVILSQLINLYESKMYK